MNEKLNHLKWILTDQIMDLTIATTAIREHITASNFDPASQKTISYFRMCSTSLIVSLSKLWEALKHYGKEINSFPEPLKLSCRALKSEIERRKIYQFRSKYAAHIIDDKTKQPLSFKEGEKRYSAIVGTTIGDLIGFCDWIIPEEYSRKPESVMHTVLATRDYCLSIVGSSTERP
ncbi:hypothetical protein [Pseudomonas putida]|uniref:hypothetical protein n=1 Tax=Pseudomonas putida TaxID=303 RepID=UPI001E47D5A5|nr:hypothetical protein [Pseudomonas putida]MCE0974750.1 hypothetical protein [Pseudomonas putida]